MSSWVKNRIKQIAEAATLEAIGRQNTVRFQQNDYGSQGQEGKVISVSNTNRLPIKDQYGNETIPEDAGTTLTPSTVKVALTNGTTVTVAMGNRWLQPGGITVVYGGVAH